MQQENVAHSKNDVAQASPNRLILAGDGKQGAGTSNASSQVGALAPLQWGPGCDHCLDEAEVLALEGVDALAYFLSQSKAVLFEYFLQIVWVGLDEEAALFTYYAVWLGRHHHAVLFDEGDQLELVFAFLCKIADGSPDLLAILGHADLGDVLVDLEQGVAARLLAICPRDESPADQRNECHTAQGHGHAHGGEREQTIGFGSLDQFRSQCRYYDVGGCANHGHHAAEYAGEGQGHEQYAGRSGSLRRGSQGDRQHEGEGADVVHEGRTYHDHTGKGKNMTGLALGQWQDAAGQHVHHTRVTEGPTDHQHRRHRDDGGMAEAQQQALGILDQYGRFPAEKQVGQGQGDQ